MPDFNWLDWLLLLILAVSSLSALRKGFSRVIIGIVTSIAAIVLAMWFYGLAGALYSTFTDSENLMNLLGFITVLVVVWVTGGLLGWIIHRFLSTAGLSWLDRLLGLAFGLIRGILVCMAILTAYMSFGPKPEEKTMPAAVLRSRIAPSILQASRLFVAIAPMDLKQSFQKHYSEAEAVWTNPLKATKKPKTEEQ